MWMKHEYKKEMEIQLKSRKINPNLIALHAALNLFLIDEKKKIRKETLAFRHLGKVEHNIFARETQLARDAYIKKETRNIHS